MEKPKINIYHERGQSHETNIDEVIFYTKIQVKIILLQLKEKIEDGEFGMVLGVDGSGRVPALMLWKAAKTVSDIESRFVVGSRCVNNDERDIRKQEFVRYFSNEDFIEATQHKKVLVVDDVLASGKSIQLICHALEEVHIPYEVAVLSMHHAEYNEELVQMAGTQIVYSDEDMPEVYGKKQMSGVAKTSAIHSTPLHMGPVPNNNLPGDFKSVANPEVLKRTRELVSVAAKELAAELGWT